MTPLRTLALAATLASAVATPVFAQDAPAKAQVGWSTASNVGELLDDPTTNAVLVKDAPVTTANPRLSAEGRSLSLDEIVPYAPELTPEVMAKINADLAKIQRK